VNTFKPTLGALPKIDASQAGTVRERVVPDAVDAAGDRDAGQAGAVHERLFPDAGDTGGDSVVSGLALRVLNERGLVLVEQNPTQLL